MGDVWEHSIVAVSIVGYAFSSVAMTLINKAAVKAFQYPYWLSMLQNATTLVFAVVIGTVFLPHSDRFGFRLKVDPSVLRVWMPAVTMFVAMLISSLSAMEYISVPSVLVFRSVTPLVTSCVAVPVLGTIPSASEWYSLLLIFVGALSYLIADPDFSLPGYAWMVVNLVAASAYHVYVKSVINQLKPSTMDLVLWNNLLSLPIIFGLGMLLDHPTSAATDLGRISLGGWIAVSSSFVVAGCIAFSGFLLQANVSPTTATVINHLVKVVTFIASGLFFGDSFSLWMIIGAVLTLAGTVWYSHLQRRKSAPPSNAPMKGAPDVDTATKTATPPPAPNKKPDEQTSLLNSKGPAVPSTPASGPQKV